MANKRVFDFDLQTNKLNNLFKGKIKTRIIAGKAQNAVLDIAKANSGLTFEIVAYEKDFVRFGDGVINALKQVGVKYSVFLITDSDLNFTNPQKVLSSSSGEVIVLGDKNLISHVLFYASGKTERVHAILTEPYAEGLLGDTVTVPDGKFFKSITVTKLESLILDKYILNKADSDDIAYSYIKTISKLVALIDYKFNVLIGAKKFNKTAYDSTRLAVTLVSNLASFDNQVEILTYASVLLAEVLCSSDVIVYGAQTLVAHAIELVSPNADKGDVGYLAFDKVIKLYHAFFVNDLTNLLSVANYNDEVASISKISGKSSAYFYENLKIPSDKRRQLYAKLLTLTRSGFANETLTVLKVLPNIKTTYCALKNKKPFSVNLKYSVLKNGVTLAPYLTNQVTVLTLMRDFGVLNLFK